MQLHGFSVRLFAGFALVAAVTSGCQNMNKAQRGAATGAGLGGLIGGIVGHQSGQREKGTLIGAFTGAIGGGLLGDAQDARDQRDAALAQAHYQRQQREVAQRALTNREIVGMSQQGLSDQIIVGAIAERGGQFDTGPEHLHYLAQNGVSEPVIRAMQRYNAVYR